MRSRFGGDGNNRLSRRSMMDGVKRREKG